MAWAPHAFTLEELSAAKLFQLALFGPPANVISTKKMINKQHDNCFILPRALFCLLVTFEIATMPGLELVLLLVHSMPCFNATLRGHRWEIAHGRVVVNGKMQKHRARENVK